MIDLQKFPGKPWVAVVLIWVGFITSRVSYFLSYYYSSFFSVETFLWISAVVAIVQLAFFFYTWLTFWKIMQMNYPKATLEVFFLLVLLGSLLPNLFFLAYDPIAAIAPSLAQSVLVGMNLFHLLTLLLFGLGVLVNKVELFGLKTPFGLLLIMVALSGSLFFVVPIWSNEALYFAINGAESFVSLLYSIVFTSLFLRARTAESGAPAPSDLLIEEIGEAEEDL